MTGVRPTRRQVLLGSAALLASARGLTAPAARRLRVIVVGAGMAGLSAADALRTRGHEVTVLEATMRAGGRVRTLREPFSDGLFAEAGAGRIPTTHALTRQYVKRFGLTLRPYRPAKPEVYGFGEDRFVLGPGEKLPLARTHLPFSDAERQLDLDGLYRRYVVHAGGRRRGPGGLADGRSRRAARAEHRPGAAGRRRLRGSRLAAHRGVRRRLRGGLPPIAREEVEGGASFSWHEQPFQQGAYVVFEPAETLQLLPVFAAAKGRLHFAGEHTSPWPGWIQGAIHSGLRAAREVVAAG